MRQILFLLCLCLVFSACAPAREEGSVDIQQLSQPVSFYPQEAGATWHYLPSGSSLAAPKVIQEVEGPTVVDGELWIVTHLEGMGLDNRWFRQYRPDGVYLLKELRPGQEVTYDPPLQEFPAEATFRVGANWGGDTTANVYFPAAQAENQRQSYQVEYRYTVVDEREVRLQVGTFQAYVIDFVARFLDDERNVIDSQKLTIWFVPNVGEIKTENDFFLVATNTL